MLQWPWLFCSNTLFFHFFQVILSHHTSSKGTWFHLFYLSLENNLYTWPRVYLILPCTTVTWRVSSLFRAPNNAPPCHLAWMVGYLLHLPVSITSNSWQSIMLTVAYCLESPKAVVFTSHNQTALHGSWESSKVILNQHLIMKI